MLTLHRYAAAQSVDPRDTSTKQSFDVNTSRQGWVPPVWDHGSQHDMSAIYETNENVVHYAPPVNGMGLPVNQMDMNMNPMYGDPVQMPMHMPAYPQSPAYAMNPNPPPAYSSYSQPMVPFGGTPVYATAPQYAQQQKQAQGKRTRKRGNKDSGRPRQDQNLNQNHNYDAAFGHNYQFQFKQPGSFIGSSYSHSRNNFRNDYGSSDATSNAAGGADNRGPKKSKHKPFHKTKYQQNAYPERGNHRDQSTNAESDKAYFPTPQVNNPVGSDLPQMIANGGFDTAKVNVGEEYQGMPIQPQGQNHGQTNNHTYGQAHSEYVAAGKGGEYVVAWLFGNNWSDFMVRDVHDEKNSTLPYADRMTAW